MGYLCFFTRLELRKSRYEPAPLSKQYEGLKRRMKKINAFRIHCYIFILLWISYGMWNFFCRISIILEMDLEKYNILVNYATLGFHVYMILNPAIFTILIKPEVTEYRIDGNTQKCRSRNSTENENFEEQIAVEGELDATIRIKYPEAIQGMRSNIPSIFFVSVDVHNQPPEKFTQQSVKQLYLENTPVSFQTQIVDDSVIAKCEKRSVVGKESDIAG